MEKVKEAHRVGAARHADHERLAGLHQAVSLNRVTHTSQQSQG
jgi:hypothetical protein